ncbi:MAG: hypothetical protein J6C46_01390 [Clostridia bacterium]|nr:hypothetical protein [Clostridia bacterium]
MIWYRRNNELYCTDTIVKYEKVLLESKLSDKEQSQKKYFKSNEQQIQVAQEEKTVKKVEQVDYHVGFCDLVSDNEINNVSIRTESGWIKIPFAEAVRFDEFTDPIDLIRESPSVYKVIQVFEGDAETKQLYDFYNQIFSTNYDVHFMFAPCCVSGDDYCFIAVVYKGLPVEVY